MLGRWTAIFRGHKVTIYNWWIEDKREFFVVHHY